MPDDYEQKSNLILPFNGWWYVANGGIDRNNSHSWDVINQRYAYDFYILNENNCSYRNNGQNLEDYYAFGQPVISPGDGIVVAVNDGISDCIRSKAEKEKHNWDIRDFRGNYVIICHNKGEYSFICHLMKKSIKVKRGDFVRRGELIGLCGSSGHSTEPHIHFHCQDHANFFLAVGLPIKFFNYKVKENGKCQNVAQGYISRGQKVANQ